MNEVILNAKGIRKSFVKGKEKINVLRGIELQVLRGEPILILGPSGSGKTTLLHILGLIDLPTKGELFLNGKNLNSLGDIELSRIRNNWFGFIFQFYNLISDLTALENCILPLIIKGLPIKSAQNEGVKLLKELGLEKRMHYYPRDLSGGEEQRIAIARAVVGSPAILFADEPSGNLDRKNENLIMDIFFNLTEKKNMSLVMVSHNESLRGRFKKVYHLKNGILERETAYA